MVGFLWLIPILYSGLHANSVTFPFIVPLLGIQRLLLRSNDFEYKIMWGRKTKKEKFNNSSFLS